MTTGDATDLIEKYRQAVEEREQRGGFARQTEAGRDLLLSRDPAAIAEWLCSQRRYHLQTGPAGRSGKLGAVMRGLVLRGGGGTGMPADNPWGIPPESDVEQLIRHVWAPLSGNAAGVVDCLAERVFAVALVGRRGGDCLAYLYGGEPSEDCDDGKDWAAASMPDLVRSALFGAEVCWGDSPQTQHPQTVDVLGGPLPAPMLELSAVHRSLYFTNLEGAIDPGRLEPYDGWLSTDYDEHDEDDGDDDGDGSRLPASMSGRFVMFAGYQDGSSGLDLHRLDADGVPLVVRHDCNDGLRGDGARFWDWFDREARLYLTEYR